MCQTATSIANARGIAKGLYGKLNDLLAGLRC
jgi:hypothetical protein